MGTNITEYLTIQKELEDTNDQLNAINNNLPVWLSIIDKKHRFVYLNDYYQRTFGGKIKDYVGRHVRDVLGEETYDIGASYYERALAGETITYFNFAEQNDEKYVAQVTLAPQTPGSKGKNFYVVALDVTKQYQEDGEFQAYIETLTLKNDGNHRKA